MDVIKNYIDGQMVESSSSRTADVMNPATGEVQAQVRLSSKDELDAAVAKAAEAQKAWGATNPQRRARVMMKFGQLINQHMDELAELVSRTPKPSPGMCGLFGPAFDIAWKVHSRRGASCAPRRDIDTCKYVLGGCR